MNAGTFGIPSGQAPGARRLMALLRAVPLPVANLSSGAVVAGAVAVTRTLPADIAALQTVLRLSRAGVLGWMGLHNGSGLSGSVRCRIMIDEIVVLDLTGSCPAGSGLCFAGAANYDTAPSFSRCELPFMRELVVQVASSTGGSHSALYQAEVYA